ncbi:MAG: hypothetical protein KY447_03000 [Actinobacteria bacterium]|nr:hypothetical protein [Actinomycetota bacterium]MBW3641861.1 hypothetical protein [Actinomycetota bacterium]
METRRWTNPSHPQTLQIAVFLLYANAVFGLLFRAPFVLFGVTLGFLVVVAYAAGGFGLANDQNWGYGVSVAVSALVLVASVVRFGVLGPNLVSLLFDVALLVLLLHPQSRSYQQIWFK